MADESAKADVAQLVEQRFRKPQVVGSIPTVGSRFLMCSRGEVEQLRKLSEQVVGFMDGYVYVLKSGRTGRYYIGSTDHLIRRYQQHANGFVHTTARMLPVTMVGWRAFETLESARMQERALKNKKSRAYIEQWLTSQQKPM